MTLPSMLEVYNIGKSYLFGENTSPPPSPDSGLNKGKCASNESYHSVGTPNSSVITPISSVITPNKHTSSSPSQDSGLNKGKRASNESYHSVGTPKSSVITPISSVITPISSNVTPNKLDPYTTFPSKQENYDSVFLSSIHNSSLMKRRRKKQKIKELSKHTNNKNRNRIRIRSV